MIFRNYPMGSTPGIKTTYLTYPLFVFYQLKFALRSGLGVKINIQIDGQCYFCSYNISMDFRDVPE